MRGLNRLTRISDAGDLETYVGYSYLGGGTIVAVEHPGVTGGLTLGYGASTDPGGGYGGLDRFGRVLDQAWVVDSAAVDRFRYGYDGAGNRQWRQNWITHADPVNLPQLDEFYAYDTLNRLTATDRGTLVGAPYSSISASTFQQNWTLDQQGNWTEFDDDGATQTREFNEANEIVSISGQADPRYDSAGNMTFDGTQHYRYDAWNRLVEVRADDSGEPGAIVAAYRYDGQNRRIVRLLGANPADPDARFDYYYNENWQVLEERLDGSGNPYAQYVWDRRYIDAPVLRWRDADTDGTVDHTLYYATDANMNVTALVDAATGAVVERYVYDAYGRVTFYEPDWSDTLAESTFANPVLYAGYRLDGETGLFHVRNRYYDPALGRWLTRDPAGYVDGMSLYAYARSSPATLVDPWGREGQPAPTTQPDTDENPWYRERTASGYDTAQGAFQPRDWREALLAGLTSLTPEEIALFDQAQAVDARIAYGILVGILAHNRIGHAWKTHYGDEVFHNYWSLDTIVRRWDGNPEKLVLGQLKPDIACRIGGTIHVFQIKSESAGAGVALPIAQSHVAQFGLAGLAAQLGSSRLPMANMSTPVEIGLGTITWRSPQDGVILYRFNKRAVPAPKPVEVEKPSLRPAPAPVPAYSPRFSLEPMPPQPAPQTAWIAVALATIWQAAKTSTEIGVRATAATVTVLSDIVIGIQLRMMYPEYLNDEDDNII